jgi:hypothetical protein
LEQEDRRGRWQRKEREIEQKGKATSSNEKELPPAETLLNPGHCLLQEHGRCNGRGLDQTEKIFILYAGVGECYTPHKYRLAVQDEYVLALGRFLNSGRRLHAPIDRTGIIQAFRERMAAEA